MNRNKESTHSIFLALAGFYILKVAYDLFASMNDGSNTMERWLVILFIVVFAVAGAGVLFYAWRSWQKGKKEEENPKKEDADSIK